MWYNYTNSRRDKGRPYGIDKYKEFYCCKEYSESAKAVFGRTLKELHQEFVRWLVR